MAIAWVRTSAIGNGQSVSSLAFAFTGTPTIGDYVVVTAWIGTQGTLSGITIADNATGGSNTYVPQGLKADPTGGTCCVIWYARVVNTVNNLQVTITCPGGSFIVAVAAEFSGIAAANPIDGTPVVNNGTTPSTGTAPFNIATGNGTITSGSLVVTVLNYSQGPIFTITKPSGQTQLSLDDFSNDSGGTNEYGQSGYVINPASPYNPQWSIGQPSNTHTWADPGGPWGVSVAQVAFLAAGSGIQFDNASNSGYQAAASSLSWSHVWAGSNRMLAIDVSLLSVTDTVSAMTYGGAACTFVGGQNVVGGTGRVENWRICQNDSGAPAVGSNTIAVTLSGSVAAAGTAVSYTGVSQSGSTEAWNGNSGINSGSGTNATVVVTTITANDWVHAALATNQSSGIASSQNSRNVVAGALGTGANADTGPNSIGAQTMTFTGEGITSAWTVGGYGIVPATAAPPIIVTAKSAAILGAA